MNAPARGPAPAGARGVLAVLAVLGGPVPCALGQEPIDGGVPAFSVPSLPITALYSATSGEYAGGSGRRHMNFDISFGPFIPIEGDEDFDVGGTIDLKFQGEVVKHLFLGGEFAYAGHDKSPSQLFFEGTLNRFYFLVPVEIDIPFAGYEENPFSVRFGVAPGIQVVDPVVDPDVKDAFQIGLGLKPEEDTFVAFDLRARVGLRLPVSPHFGFLFEVAYDWAEGTGRTRFKDLATGATVDPVSRTVMLSGVSVLLGFQFVF